MGGIGRKTAGVAETARKSPATSCHVPSPSCSAPGLEDFWPSDCSLDSNRQHYLYWAIAVWHGFFSDFRGPNTGLGVLSFNPPWHCLGRDEGFTWVDPIFSQFWWWKMRIMKWEAIAIWGTVFSPNCTQKQIQKGGRTSVLEMFDQ